MRTAPPINMSGIATGVTLTLVLLATVPAVMAQNHFLLDIDKTLSNISSIRQESYVAFKRDKKPDTETDATEYGIGLGIFPASWVEGQRVIHPFDGTLQLFKSAEGGVRILSLVLNDMPAAACSALLWRLSSKRNFHNWASISADGQRVGYSLTPAESRQHCHDLTDISLSYRY